MLKYRQSLLTAVTCTILVTVSSAQAATTQITATDSKGVVKDTYAVGETVNFQGTFQPDSNTIDVGKYGWGLGGGCSVVITRIDTEGWNQDNISGNGSDYHYYLYDDLYNIDYPSSPPCPNLNSKSVARTFLTPGTHRVGFHAFEWHRSIHNFEYYDWQSHHWTTKTITVVPAPTTDYLPSVLSLILD